MPYDPLDTIRLIQQPIDFLLDFFRTFELNLSYIAKEKDGNTEQLSQVIHDCHERGDKSCCFSRSMGRVCDRDHRRLSRTKWRRRNSTQINILDLQSTQVFRGLSYMATAKYAINIISVHNFTELHISPIFGGAP